MESASLIAGITSEDIGHQAINPPSLPTMQKAILVTCPTCKVQGTKVFLPDCMQARAKNPASIVRMLFSHEFCKHAFIAYLDKDMNVKGYEGIDLVL